MEHDQQDIESTLHLLDNSPIEDYEGFSKADMRYLIYKPFSSDSPLQIKKNIPNNVLDKIPLLKQIEYVLDRLLEIDGLKLTPNGFLPIHFVKEIYNTKFIKEEMIDDEIIKLYFETSSFSVRVTRLVCELGGLIINKQNKMYLAPEWKEFVVNNNRQMILQSIFTTYTQKLDWANTSRNQNYNTGQFGFAFSLFLLSKYGNTLRDSLFYVNKYLKAFPSTLSDPLIFRDISSFNFDFSSKTFECIAEYFNLVKCKYISNQKESELLFRKSDIFDKILTFDQ